jgi:hypothetical protein
VLIAHMISGKAAVRVQQDSVLTLTRARITDLANPGISLDPSCDNATSCGAPPEGTIADLELDDGAGFGVAASRGSILTLTRARVRAVAGFGVGANYRAELSASDVSISEVIGESDGCALLAGCSGLGMAALFEGSVDVRRFLVKSDCTAGLRFAGEASRASDGVIEGCGTGIESDSEETARDLLRYVVLQKNGTNIEITGSR